MFPDGDRKDWGLSARAIAVGSAIAVAALAIAASANLATVIFVPAIEVISVVLSTWHDPAVLVLEDPWLHLDR